MTLCGFARGGRVNVYTGAGTRAWPGDAQRIRRPISSVP